MMGAQHAEKVKGTKWTSRVKGSKIPSNKVIRDEFRDVCFSLTYSCGVNPNKISNKTKRRKTFKSKSTYKKLH